MSSLRKLVNGTIAKAGSEDEITTFAYGTESTVAKDPSGNEDTYHYDLFGNTLEEPELQAAASEFYADYAELTLGDATKAIELEDHASILDAQLSQQLGDNYTGEWFDTGTGHVKIGITADGYERTVETDLDNLGLSDNADIVIEPASWGELNSARSSLAATLHTLRTAGLVTVGIDSSADAVLVDEANSLTSAQKAEVVSAANALSVPHGIIESSSASLRFERFDCNKSEGNCDAPLRGGVGIVLTTGPENVHNCSAGFITKSSHASAKYLLTAGHCVEVEFGENTWRAFDAPGEPHDIGKGRSWALGTQKELEGHKGDYGLISIESSYWTKSFTELKPWIVVWPSTEAGTTYKKQYAIRSVHPGDEIKQKFVVCTGGVGEGGVFGVPREDCGEVIQTTTGSLKAEEGEPAVEEVGPIIEVNYCAKATKNNLRKGNSGSPTYKNHVAYGIFTAGSGCFGAVQPIAEAEAALHVHVITGASSGH